MILGITHTIDRSKYSTETEYYENPDIDLLVLEPIRTGKRICIDVLPVLQCDNPYFNENTKPMLYVGKQFEKTPHILPVFKIECSILIYGKDAVNNFERTCFKI